MGLLEEMKKKGLDADVILYSGLCNEGSFDRGKELFNEMLEKGICPNVVTYTCFDALSL